MASSSGINLEESLPIIEEKNRLLMEKFEAFIREHEVKNGPLEDDDGIIFPELAEENRPLMEKIEGMYEINVSLLSFNCAIFRVPELLRAVNDSSYTPSVISIGPFHRNGGVGLQFMEQQKGRYLKHLLRQRFGNYMMDRSLTHIRRCESEVRQSYGEHFELSSDDFVLMVLTDGLFIIEYFTRLRVKPLRDEYDNILYDSKLSKSIMNDLVLMENQLPFFILQKLYEIVSRPHPYFQKGLDDALPPVQLGKDSFFKICWGSFPNFTRLNDDRPPPEGYEPPDSYYLLKPGPVLHFTDLVTRIHVMPLSPTDTRIHVMPLSPTDSGEMMPLSPTDTGKIGPPPMSASTAFHLRERGRKHISSYSAKELTEHGINFQVSSSVKHLLDVEFTDNGVLQIPRLEIFDETESLFRNMMAWEQYGYTGIQNIVCDYVHLMDTLIDTSEDVELLVQKGIIKNNIGDPEKVATLFNNLNRQIMNNRVEDSYYYPIYANLNSYYLMHWPKWKRSLIKEYFGSPWKVASVIAAAILLVLTLLQTINSFKS